MKLHIFAPAKVNWTLEVLGRLEDGYHEVSTILQTLDICDRITLSRGDEVQVQVTGRAEELAKEPPEENLAFRAALALRQEVGERVWALDRAGEGDPDGRRPGRRQQRRRSGPQRAERALGPGTSPWRSYRR